MEKELESYLKNLLPPKKEWVTKLENQAMEENVPIMDPVSIHFLMQLVKVHKPKSILEIGTAIGYSALRMVEAYPETSVVTIERDEHRYQQALQNIQLLEKQSTIQVIKGDALEKIKELPQDQLFDLIFIDAAKGKYKQFFKLANDYLTPNGVIVSDNVLFKGYVADPFKQHPRYQKMATSIRAYNEWLIQLPNYETTIVPIGDGVAITTRNESKEEQDLCKENQL
ncbi:O-methyltransferase [Oceanobacillus halotolerans]|uniref:O-methyltransferase n=1 Tax=Oceanobacillus halotolerans TaxID=2663380 RepID=UPI0013DBB7DB|nr:O-methyltransferase [Oceanobacillus halotolerans]